MVVAVALWVKHGLLDVEQSVGAHEARGSPRVNNQSASSYATYHVERLTVGFSEIGEETHRSGILWLIIILVHAVDLWASGVERVLGESHDASERRAD